jgi:uncharacterized protein YndB with AHSA1/START domain
MFDLLRRLYAPTTVAAVLPAPPETVYGVISDPTTYPDWLVGADHMRAVDDAFPRPGSTFEHSVGPGEPLTVDDRTESLAAEPNRHLALDVHAGPFEARVDFELRPAEGGRTALRFSERPVGWFAPLTPLLRFSLHARNAASVDRLRRLLTAAA